MVNTIPIIMPHDPMDKPKLLYKPTLNTSQGAMPKCCTLTVIEIPKLNVTKPRKKTNNRI